MLGLLGLGAVIVVGLRVAGRMKADLRHAVVDEGPVEDVDDFDGVLDCRELDLPLEVDHGAHHGGRLELDLLDLVRGETA